MPAFCLSLQGAPHKARPCLPHSPLRASRFLPLSPPARNAPRCLPFSMQPEKLPKCLVYPYLPYPGAPHNPRAPYDAFICLPQPGDPHDACPCYLRPAVSERPMMPPSHPRAGPERSNMPALVPLVPGTPQEARIPALVGMHRSVVLPVQQCSAVYRLDGLAQHRSCCTGPLHYRYNTVLQRCSTSGRG